MKEKTFYVRYILTYKNVKNEIITKEIHDINKLLNTHTRIISKGGESLELTVIDPKTTTTNIKSEEKISKFIREKTNKSKKHHDLKEEEKINIEE